MSRKTSAGPRHPLDVPLARSLQRTLAQYTRKSAAHSAGLNLVELVYWGRKLRKVLVQVAKSRGSRDAEAEGLGWLSALLFEIASHSHDALRVVKSVVARFLADAERTEDAKSRLAPKRALARRQTGGRRSRRE